MNPPENIPLGEAVARGIIPCSVCGAQGADVRKIGTRNHFLCARCASRGRGWIGILVALGVAALGIVGFLIVRMRPGPDAPMPPEAHGDPEPWMKETSRLMKEGRFREAKDRTLDLLEKMPKDPLLHLTLGRCLMNLGAAEAAIPHFITARSGEFQGDASLWLGMAYKKIGHLARALPLIEERLKADPGGHLELAEVYIDLERYDDALAVLPEGPSSIRLRHRALTGLGKAEEARALVAGRDDVEAVTLRAGQLREDGDFAGAAALLRGLQEAAGTAGWVRLKRAAQSLAVESGDLAALDAVAADLRADKDPQIQAEGIYAQTLAHLLAGRRDAAKAGAGEFLAKTDKDLWRIRFERLTMRHLAGDLKDADLEAEAALVSRYHANDLLWYLALATGDRAKAEKALAATPGHNYPYHAIQRLLKK